MNIKIQATNLELTSDVRDYLDKKLPYFEQFLEHGGGAALCEVEVEKTTAHHKQGSIYRAEINITDGGSHYRAESRQENIYAAIDEVKDDMSRELKRSKNKKRTLVRRGGAKVKALLKGLKF